MCCSSSKKAPAQLLRVDGQLHICVDAVPKLVESNKVNSVGERSSSNPVSLHCLHAVGQTSEDNNGALFIRKSYLRSYQLSF